ncbi:MAG: hypothetical protein LC107_01600 [Chitinophagales bacterium]|nr:hypothetical protein [Chitinophagales bacterium]
MYFDSIDYYDVAQPKDDDYRYSIYRYVYDTVSDVAIPVFGTVQISGTNTSCKLPLKPFKKDISKEHYVFWTCHEANPWVYTVSIKNVKDLGEVEETVELKHGLKSTKIKALNDALVLVLKVFATNKDDLDLGIYNALISLEGSIPDFNQKVKQMYKENHISYFDEYWRKLHTYLTPLELLAYTDITFDNADDAALDYYRLTMGYNSVPTNALFTFDSTCVSSDVIDEASFIQQINAAKVILFGENHYDPKTRRVIATMLDKFKEASYTDIFFEALQLRHGVSDSGLLSIGDGFYTNESEMANLVRKAMKSGFRVHAYDETYTFCDTCKTQFDFYKYRETSAMKNMQDSVRKYDIPKFIVVSGFGHSYKSTFKNGNEPLGKLLADEYGNDSVVSIRLFNQQQLDLPEHVSWAAKPCDPLKYDYEIIFNPDFYAIESKNYKTRGYDKVLNLKKYKLDKNVIKLIPKELYKENLTIPYFTSHPDSPKHYLVPVYKGEYVLIVENRFGNRMKRKYIKI